MKARSGSSGTGSAAAALPPGWGGGGAGTVSPGLQRTASSAHCHNPATHPSGADRWLLGLTTEVERVKNSTWELGTAWAAMSQRRAPSIPPLPSSAFPVCQLLHHRSHVNSAAASPGML